MDGLKALDPNRPIREADIRVDPKEKLPDLARGFVVGTLSRLPVELIVQPDAHDVSVK
jgi:hypothetical protein